MKYRSVIADDTRGLKMRLRKVTHPHAGSVALLERRQMEVRPYTADRIQQLWRDQKGRRVKTVARHLYEGEGRRARKLYELLGHTRFRQLWETYPRGIWLDFALGDAFVDGDVVPMQQMLKTWSSSPPLVNPERVNLLVAPS